MTVRKPQQMIGAMAAAWLLTTALAAGQELPRRAQLGVALEAANGGARVTVVTPGATAANAGVKVGDIITGLNGVATPNTGALVEAAGALRSGAEVRLSLERNGEVQTVRAQATPRPLESYTRADASYGAVAFRGGLLRDILVTPAGAKPDHPVVFLIQGYMCGTVEGPTPNHPYRGLVQGLADRGIATYRIEKPGMGDSQGGPQCEDIDFDVELDAFRTGLKALIETRRVAPRRIILLGHSMGGVQAPLLAAERGGELRGLAVMGTVLRSWHDYMIEVFRLQGFYNAGEDPVELEMVATEVRPLLDRIFGSDDTLTEIANDTPQYADFMRRMMWWDGRDQILARSVAFWRGVSRQSLTKAFRDARVPVLAMYGEADFAALDDRDHRLIADVVNHYRAGAGTFVTLPATGHGFGLEGTREEARTFNATRGQPMNFNAPYSAAVHQALADWIEKLPVPR